MAVMLTQGTMAFGVPFWRVEDLAKYVGEAVLGPALLEIETRRIVNQFLDTTTTK